VCPRIRSNAFQEQRRHCEPREAGRSNLKNDLPEARHRACLRAEATQGRITTTAGALASSPYTLKRKCMPNSYRLVRLLPAQRKNSWTAAVPSHHFKTQAKSKFCRAPKFAFCQRLGGKIKCLNEQILVIYSQSLSL